MLAGALAGCDGSGQSMSATQPSMQTSTQPASQVLPPPLAALMPRTIRIHPFTGMRTFDESGGIRGIDVRIEAKDAWGDSCKAIGDFRFELYAYRQENSDPKGEQVARWEEPLSDIKVNALHWDHITRTYEFKLQWSRSIPVGHRFVLVAYFISPYTQRLATECVFFAGQ
jgi:hypothetical protein